MKITALLKWTLAICLACLACSQMQETLPGRAVDETWSLEALKNGCYSGLQVSADPVRLYDGHWEGAPYVAGGASRPTIHFVGDFFRIGRLSDRPADVAVVFLAESSGGSGTFVYLAVVEKIDRTLVNTATAPLGDRVQVRDVRIGDGIIAVDVLQAGPQDAACCPGELATRHWQRASGGLVESAAAVSTGRFSPQALTGSGWKLRAWDAHAPAPDEPLISLFFEDGKLAGSAGCNRYFTHVTTGSHPGEIRVGPVGSTRMICPEPMMAVERRFLKQLSGATKLGFLAGQLTVSFEIDGQIKSMRFDRLKTTP